MAAGNFSATLREQEPTADKADVAHSPLAQGRWEPAAVWRSFAAALSQRSGLLLNRQAAGHAYAFSSCIFSSLLLFCMAAIQSS